MFDRLSYKFEIKALDDAKPGEFSGRASVYGVVDSYDEVVMPGAFTRTIAEHAGEIVVLNQHNAADPIGLATLTDAADGLHCVGRLELELPSAREAYTRLKSRLINGISIGFNTINERMGARGVRELLEVNLWEISLVTFPANSFARVTGVKALQRDLQQLVALCDARKEGRVLSTSNRRVLTDCASSMRAALIQIDDLLTLTDPDTDKSASPVIDPAVSASLKALTHEMRAHLAPAA